MDKQPDLRRLHQGFTLVELSIVLVIIALLVGGILGMRTYVRNAELNSIMNEAKFYISAFNQFQTRYNAPPGDYDNASAAWNGAGNGDGNGIIRADGAGGNTNELWYVFQHLSMAGYIQGNYTGAANAFGGASVASANGTGGTPGNIPGSAVTGGAYFFDHPSAVDGIVSGDAMYFDGNYGNVMRVARNIANNSSVPDVGLFSGKQASLLDTKFDDGKPNTGNIVTRKYSAAAPTSLCATNGAPPAYNLTDDEMTCWLIIKVQ